MGQPPVEASGQLKLQLQSRLLVLQEMERLQTCHAELPSKLESLAQVVFAVEAAVVVVEPNPMANDGDQRMKWYCRVGGVIVLVDCGPRGEVNG